MQLTRWKQIVKPIVPVGLMELNARIYTKSLRQKEEGRRRRFDTLRSSVGDAIASIRALTDAQSVDLDFLENEFIPSLGLNDQSLEQQPPELSTTFGKGLHIWQYPNQLAGYLAWLAKNSSGITSYMEVGCRWGGMFILVSEWVRKNGGDLRSVTAVDPIEPTPFIRTYFDLLRAQSETGIQAIEATYINEFSTSSAVRDAIDRLRPDFVFIDGDHHLQGALFDHMLVRRYANVIVHHDVCSQACPDTTFLWETLKELESDRFDFAEFVGQYPSVKGNFLGIGVMKRKMLS